MRFSNYNHTIAILNLSFKFIYSRKNADKPIKIYSRKSNKEAIEAVFNPDAPIKILCHGFLSNYKKPFPTRMKNGKS